MVGHEYIRGLDVAMDNPFLMCVLDSLANLNKKLQPFFGGKIVLIAVVCDLDASHQFHDEVGPAGREALTPDPSPIRWERGTTGRCDVPLPLPRRGGEGRGGQRAHTWVTL